jgi:hypothetical protein
MLRGGRSNPNLGLTAIRSFMLRQARHRQKLFASTSSAFQSVDFQDASELETLMDRRSRGDETGARRKTPVFFEPAPAEDDGRTRLATVCGDQSCQIRLSYSFT